MAFERYFVRVLQAAAPAATCAEPSPKLAVTLLEGSHFDMTEARGQVKGSVSLLEWCRNPAFLPAGQLSSAQSSKSGSLVPLFRFAA